MSELLQSDDGIIEKKSVHNMWDMGVKVLLHLLKSYSL